ncbi:MAG: hypothetical protein D6722_10200 [Bacteroidetes bacterium]|nr:MAG: hypothetical protein D6722_10200 [Bacteroidota bacterium]
MIFTLYIKSAHRGALFLLGILGLAACQPEPAPQVPVPTGPVWTERTAAQSSLHLEGLRALCLDGEGGVFAGGEAGFLIHIGADGSAQEWELGAPIRALARTESFLWVGTEQGLLRFAEGAWVTLAPLGTGAADRDITALTVDPSGHLWAGTRSGALARRAGSQWEAVTVPFAGPVEGRLIGALHHTGAGVLRVGTRGEGVWQREGEVWGRLPIRGAVAALAPGSLSQWWAGTQGEGLFWVGTQGLLPIGGPQGLRSDSIADIQVDARGFAWVATARGVHVISDPQGSPDLRVDTWGDSRGLAHQDIRALVLAPDGTVWVATRRALWSYQP